MKISFPFSIQDLITSYTLISGIGYVWIIRIFFTIAVVSPLLFTISKKVTTLPLKLVTFIVLLFVQNSLNLVSYSLTGGISTLFDEFIVASFGYSIAALIGMWAVKQNMKENFIFSLTSLLIFTLIGLKTNFSLLSDGKYPPSVYYLAYGIGISLFILVLISKKRFESIIRIKLFRWLSAHSLELYYWHIFPVSALAMLSIELNWILNFLIVFISTLIISFFQIKYIPGFFYLKLKNPM